MKSFTERVDDLIKLAREGYKNGLLPSHLYFFRKYTNASPCGCLIGAAEYTNQGFDIDKTLLEWKKFDKSFSHEEYLAKLASLGLTFDETNFIASVYDMGYKIAKGFNVYSDDDIAKIAATYSPDKEWRTVAHNIINFAKEIFAEKKDT